MKKIFMFLVTLLMCFMFTCLFTSSKNSVSAEAREATATDVIHFTESGLKDDIGDSLTIPGVEFNSETITYTLTNVNFMSDKSGHGTSYEGATEGSTIRFNFVGVNMITCNGSIDDNAFSFTIGMGHKVIFEGSGSFLIANNMTSTSTYYSTTNCGLQVAGTLEIAEGTTVVVQSGTATGKSFGTSVLGTLINKGSLTTTSFNSEPDTYENGKNGISYGLIIESCASILPGEYIQEGANSVLNAYATDKAYMSVGLYVGGSDGYYSKFKVTDGTVTAISYGCKTGGTKTRSYGIQFTTKSEVTLKNATINAETKHTENNIIDEYIELQVHFAAMFNKIYSETFLMDEKSVINLTAPTGIEIGYIYFQEEVIDELYAVSEGEEQIFVYGLEEDYPDEVEFTLDYERIVKEEQGGEEVEIIDNCVFIKTPTDGTLTFYSRSGYFSKIKSQVATEMESWESSITETNKTITANKEFDYDRLMEKNIDDLTLYFNAVCCNYCQTVADMNKEAEVDLACEYQDKFNALEIKVNGETCNFDEYHTLKAEFEEKLAALRETKASSPVLLIVGIAVGSLVVLYVVGYAMWAHGVKALTSPFFGKVYGWFDKVLKKWAKKAAEQKADEE